MLSDKELYQDVCEDLASSKLDYIIFCSKKIYDFLKNGLKLVKHKAKEGEYGWQYLKSNDVGIMWSHHLNDYEIIIKLISRKI